MSGERPPISVVIPTRNRPDRLRSCLEVLRSQVGDADEVVVVDSASTSPETQRVAAAAGARVVVAGRPGASHARNLGWQAAAHECVGFIDDDVTVLDGWADAMARALAVPGRAFVTGWIGVAPEQLHVPEPNPIVIRPEPRIIDRQVRGAVGASANCAFHRDVLRSVGGFREDMGPGNWISAAEDLELFDRVIAAGYTGYYDPRVRVYHDQWRTRRQAFALHWSYGKGMGARLAVLARTDPARAAWTAYDAVLIDGVVTIGRALRRGFESGAVFALLRVLGALVGFTARTIAR